MTSIERGRENVRHFFRLVGGVVGLVTLIGILWGLLAIADAAVNAPLG